MAEFLGGWKRDLRCGEVSEALAGQQVTLMGWVQRSRNMGGVIFVWLRDVSGIVQAVFNADKLDQKTFELGVSLRSEYVVALKGEVALRDASAVNEQMATGKVEVLVKEAKLLNAAETPPIYVEDGAKDNEAIRLKYRYLDLRKPSM